MPRPGAQQVVGTFLSVTIGLLALAVGSGVTPAPFERAAAANAASAPVKQDAFYAPPSPLPKGAPGDVLKVEDLPEAAHPDARVHRVMYLSTDARGTSVPVTGMLLTPLRQKPGNDNPLIVHAPGTRGLGDTCSPSKQASALQADPASPDYANGEYRQLLIRGISIVVTDYAGEGTPGDPSYLVGQSEGRNVLDALRAAEAIHGSGVSTASPVGISGYSQGGQAAAWAAELQPSYAPEQHLKGVLAGGVPADMLLEANHLNHAPTAGLALASLVGLNQANPELDLNSKLTPEGRQVVERVKQACYLELVAALGTTTVQQATSPDVLADPAWQQAYRASLLGTRKPAAPVYLYHGMSDTLVPLAQDDLLFHAWCSRGASVRYEVIPGPEHLSTYFLASGRGMQWLFDRVVGGPAVAGCQEVHGS